MRRADRRAGVQRRQKLRNVERDPRVVLSLETGDRNAMGLDEYLVVRGTARVTEGGAPELLQRLAHVYLSSDTRFPPVDDPPPGYVLRITPESIGGVGVRSPAEGSSADASAASSAGGAGCISRN